MLPHSVVVLPSGYVAAWSQLRPELPSPRRAPPTGTSAAPAVPFQMLAAPPAVECEDVCDFEATTGLTDEIGFSELDGGESKLRELQRPSNSPNKHPFELEPKSHERYETTND